MAAYNLSPVFQDEQFADDVLPLVGGTLTWYLAGTTTPATVYQTNTGTAHTAPIVLNARGEPPAAIWLANGTAYKCVLADADAVPIRTIDNIIGVGDTSTFSSDFSSIVIDSTGNGAKIWQDSAGNLSFQTNQDAGTQNNVSLSSTKTSSDKPVTAPKLRIGDTTVPTLPVEVVGNGYINGALRVGDTATPTQNLEVAGSVTVTGDVSPGGLGAVRYKLTSNRTYYVRTDGSDANTGLSDNAAGAFLTIQRAIDVISTTLDLGSNTVTVYVRAGNYGGFYLRPLVTSAAVSSPVSIIGDLVTPANIAVSSSGNTIAADGVKGYSIAGIRVASSGASGVFAQNNAVITLVGVTFGFCTSSHISAYLGATVLVNGSYTIELNAATHIACYGNSSVIVESGSVITLSGARAFSTAFVTSSMLSFVLFSSVSFVGTATGTRYSATFNGAIYTGGVTLPGSLAGSTATGGQYA